MTGNAKKKYTCRRINRTLTSAAPTANWVGIVGSRYSSDMHTFFEAPLLQGVSCQAMKSTQGDSSKPQACPLCILCTTDPSPRIFSFCHFPQAFNSPGRVEIRTTPKKERKMYMCRHLFNEYLPLFKMSKPRCTRSQGQRYKRFRIYPPRGSLKEVGVGATSTDDNKVVTAHLRGK